MHHHGTIQSPAGTAPADAFEPTGGALQRPVDCWIACNPENPGEEAGQRLREAAREVTGPEDGLRLRVVRPKLEVTDSILSVLPGLLGSLDRAQYAFIHAELMEGPEAGVYLAIDNRKPALIIQEWLNRPGQPLPTEGLVDGKPLHVNLHLHRADASLLDVSPKTDVGMALAAAYALGSPIHQVTMTHSAAQQSGVSIGLESIGNEQGSQGGMPAVADENHAKRGVL